MYVRLPTNIHFLVKFRISKIHNILVIRLIFLKLWITTNFNTVFLVVVLVFDFEEFSEGVLHGHWQKMGTNSFMRVRLYTQTPFLCPLYQPLERMWKLNPQNPRRALIFCACRK
jgi:hypothetical protein